MNFLRPFSAAFSIFLIGLLFFAASRWNLAYPTGPGNKDHAAFAYLLAGFTYLAYSLFPKKITTLGLGFLFTIITLLLLGNWWYYDFYQAYLTIDALSLAKYTNEISFNFAAFPFTSDTIVLVLLTLVFFTLHYRLYNGYKKLYLGLATFFLLIGTVQESRVIGTYTGGYAAEGKHPIMYMLREPFDSVNKIAVDKSHYKAASAIFDKPLMGGEHPFFAETIATKSAPEKYNVLLIVLESFRASELGAYNPEKTNTPNFDRLAKTSSLYETTYANSYQTSRGELAILCSTMDYIAGAPFSESSAPAPNNCLPQLLSENGYNTHWFHGYDTQFFNREEFLPKIGFNNIHPRDEISASAKLPPIGWGLQDIDVYDYSLKLLEKEEKPFFAEIMTLSNHYPFTWDWNIPFPDNISDNNSDSPYYNYQRGIYYTDYALGTFLDKFEKSPLKDNTILVVTADHGLWIFPEDKDTKQDLKSAVTKTDQYFRIPLIIKTPGQQEAHNIAQVASQLDIAPTVLDLLKVNYKSAHLGNSLLEKGRESEASSLMFAGGNYHFRRHNQMCYSLPNAEDKCEANESAYNHCSKNRIGINTPICIDIAGDSLMGKDLEVLSTIADNEKMLSDLKKSVDLTQYALKHGLVPNASTSPEQEAQLAAVPQSFNTSRTR